MKPRSSTEIFASSSGRNCPFKKTMSASLLQPQPQCIPGLAENACPADGLERNKRVFAQRFAIERQAKRADTLALVDWRHERRLRHELGFELFRFSFRHRDHEIVSETGFELAGCAFPYFESLHRLVCAVELHAIEELEAPVQELERLL